MEAAFMQDLKVNFHILSSCVWSPQIYTSMPPIIKFLLTMEDTVNIRLDGGLRCGVS